MASGRIILQSTTKGAGGWDHSLLNRTCSTKDVLTCQSGSCLGSFNTCTLQLPRLADLPRGNPGRGKCTNEGLVLKAATMFRSLLGSFIRGGCARPQAVFFFFLLRSWPCASKAMGSWGPILGLPESFACARTRGVFFGSNWFRCQSPACCRSQSLVSFLPVCGRPVH